MGTPRGTRPEPWMEPLSFFGVRGSTAKRQPGTPQPNLLPRLSPWALGDLISITLSLPGLSTPCSVTSIAWTLESLAMGRVSPSQGVGTEESGLVGNGC